MCFVHFPLSSLPVLCILTYHKALQEAWGGMVFNFCTSRALRKITSIIYNSRTLQCNVTTAEDKSQQSLFPGLMLEHLPLASLTSGISVLTSVGPLASHGTSGSPQRLWGPRERVKVEGDSAHREGCLKYS